MMRFVGFSKNLRLFKQWFRNWSQIFFHRARNFFKLGNRRQFLEPKSLNFAFATTYMCTIHCLSWRSKSISLLAKIYHQIVVGPVQWVSLIFAMTLVANRPTLAFLSADYAGKTHCFNGCLVSGVLWISNGAKTGWDCGWTTPPLRSCHTIAYLANSEQPQYPCDISMVSTFSRIFNLHRSTPFRKFSRLLRVKVPQLGV